MSANVRLKKAAAQTMSKDRSIAAGVRKGQHKSLYYYLDYFKAGAIASDESASYRFTGIDQALADKLGCEVLQLPSVSGHEQLPATGLLDALQTFFGSTTADAAMFEETALLALGMITEQLCSAVLDRQPDMLTTCGGHATVDEEQNTERRRDCPIQRLKRI
ncbi:hypothetical protein MRB53_042381 [Persea americana]|nr:hypothetical protein MRB53_042381 [Persea americana]